MKGYIRAHIDRDSSHNSFVEFFKSEEDALEYLLKDAIDTYDIWGDFPDDAEDWTEEQMDTYAKEQVANETLESLIENFCGYTDYSYEIFEEVEY